MSNEQPPNWQPEKDAELCAEISGFLFKHPCGMFARHRCHLCDKPICVAHSVLAGDPPGEYNICQSCSERSAEQPSPAKKNWLQPDYWDDIDVTIDDRPIWYRRKRGEKPKSVKRHREKQYDDDLTDADEIGFESDSAESNIDHSNWENDMGAS